MPRAARKASAPAPALAPDPEPEQAVRFAIHHPRCARCGHPATLGMILTDGAATGPWLCGPSSFPPPGRTGCRAPTRP